MVSASNIKDTSDGLVLKKKALVEIMRDNNLVLPMHLKKKPPTEMVGFAQKASVATAKQIMQDTEAALLLKALS